MAFIRLWVDKYRPQILDDYVWRDAQMRGKIEEWITQGSVPHLMLTGPSGTGKTTLALMIFHLLGIPKADILKRNASGKDAHVATLEADVQNFASTYAFGPTEMKYVLLDEADRMSYSAQQFLRNEVEKEENQCRFIFTANEPKKIHGAIHSRCIEIKFSALDRDEFISRAGEILCHENVEFELEDLMAHVDLTYPDLRKCINLLEGNTLGGKLRSPQPGDDGTADYLVSLVDLFKAEKYNEGRRLLIAKAQIEEYPSIFRFFYQNLPLFGTTQAQQDDALLIIRKGLVHHAHVADPEINMSATLVELIRNVELKAP